MLATYFKDWFKPISPSFYLNSFLNWTS